MGYLSSGLEDPQLFQIKEQMKVCLSDGSYVNIEVFKRKELGVQVEYFSKRKGQHCYANIQTCPVLKVGERLPDVLVEQLRLKPARQDVVTEIN